jgi:hypothetical protein
MFPVQLHVYDLSNGMAAQFSRQLIGKHIEGVWHTGIVVYNKEYYFGGGISYDDPGRTPFGKFMILTKYGRPPDKDYRSWFYRVARGTLHGVSERCEPSLYLRDL